MIELRRLMFGAVALAVAACSYDYSAATSAPPRVLASVVLSIADSVLEVGQFTQATVSLRDQVGEPFDAARVTFTSSAPDVAVISPDDGKIHALSQGTTTITASAEGKTSARVLVVSFPPIFINEVALSSAVETGWVELYNPTAKAVDLTGWTITNADVFRSAVVPAGSIVPARGFFVIDGRSFPKGLPEREAAHLFSRFGVQSDAFAWGHDPATSFGRCPDGESGLGVTAVQTRGAANVCAIP